MNQKNQTAAAIQRSDYRALPWTVERVDLAFHLDPRVTRVTSTLQCVRNPAQPEEGPLPLFGDGLELISLKVDGVVPEAVRCAHVLDGLRLMLVGERATVEIVTEIDPSSNTALSGLYESKGGLFTQCEAEGFRRITYFPDRPDVMARYCVTLEADAEAFPVLLSNGNLVERGNLPDGRHFARWEDPFPKPSYLFALVAAKLVALERQIETCSGRPVLLQLWVEEGNLDRAGHAMDSLVRALRWDEEAFGLELDLDRFMVVAVSDFNMGAMENKGLNLFNAKYVLARPDTATDVDYERIESVVAHEYFHNWTGNRVTCRDWFQLTLKEGLTVFRDQQFSADMRAQASDSAEGGASARAVKRIEDVRVLRAAQFPEDAGPMAHPIRPDAYQEINNFYTATVYEKGAEVIRMLHTLLGHEGFRNGMDLYFSYHDGQAVTCDEFVECMAEANGRDLDQFLLWYGRAGTPQVRARGRWIEPDGAYELTLSQALGEGQAPLLIPVAVGLMGQDGVDLPLRLEGEVHAQACTRVLELCEAEQSFRFTGLPAEPVPSLLRGFSAPVLLDLDEDDARLAFRMAHDSDPFNRWDAGQRYAERIILACAQDASAEVPEAFVAAFRKVLADECLDPAFRAQAAALPGEAYLLERMKPADPGRLRAALLRVMQALGTRLADDWLQILGRTVVDGPYRYHPSDAGRRALRNLALRMLAFAGNEEGMRLARRQLGEATNMTDTMGALSALVACGEDAARDALDDFRRRFDGDELVLDKWFAVQAGAWRRDSGQTPVLDRVQALTADPAFRLSNPNKVYALLGTFFNANAAEFHDADGRGHAFWADRVIELDARNPQVAARMARALENWRRYGPALQTSILAQIERVRATPELSPDVAEIIEKALGG
ncbi:MAG: aminopeptidase N [Rhodocyclaceae bacterium]|jgi:aminopeptidase N|nr:aminopeptidase N [Rhodocyclaceae bacterium]